MLGIDKHEGLGKYLLLINISGVIMKAMRIVSISILVLLFIWSATLFASPRLHSEAEMERARQLRAQGVPYNVIFQSSFPRVSGDRNNQGGFNELDDILFPSEDFDPGLPVGWTVEDSGDNVGDAWYAETFAFGSLEPPYMYVYSDFVAHIDERLISPSFSTLGYNTVTLAFDNYFTNEGVSDFAAVDVSTDGGTSWTNATIYTDDIEEYPTYLDISAWAANEADVKVRFRYDDGGTWAWSWSVDNVEVLGQTAGEGIPPAVTLVSYPEVNFAGQARTIVALASDPSGIASFDLTYGHDVLGTVEDQTTIAMSPTGTPNEYSATIPGNFQDVGDKIAWHLLAVDGSANSNERRLPAGTDTWYTYYVHHEDEDIPYNASTYTWYDISGTGTEIPLENNENVEIVFADYGFGDFEWNGEVHDRFRLCANGWITFSSSVDTSLFLPEFPNLNEPNNIIALYATDLNQPAGGNVYVGEMDGKFIIQFDAVRFFSIGYGPTGQIVLDPIAATVSLNYEDTRDDLDPYFVTGYENAQGDLGNTIASGDDWSVLPDETSYTIGHPGGDLDGYVEDDQGNPLENVEITVAIASEPSHTKVESTDVNGDYLVEDLGENFYDVTATLLGFSTETAQNVNVQSGLTTTQDFTLTGVAPSAFNLLSPANGATCYSGDTTLVWESTTDPDPADPITYHVWWATNAGFTQNLDSAAVAGGDTTLDLSNLIDETTYWWKVRAQDSHTIGTWSVTWTFEVFEIEPPGTFSLFLPADFAVVDDDTVNVFWTASTDPDPGDEITYQVEWTDDPLGVFYTAQTDVTTYAITDLADMVLGGGELDELPDDITIYWRVKAIDSYGLETWANPGITGRRFSIYIIDPPDPFSLLGPADASVCVSGDTTLTWEVATEADPDDQVDSYWVWWATDAGFTQNLDSVEVTDGTSHDLTGMIDDMTYYWKVRAQDGNTNGTWSTETWTILVFQPEPPEADGFELVSPVDGSVENTDEVNVTWTATTDPDPGDQLTYHLHWSIDEEFDPYYQATTVETEYLITDLEDALAGIGGIRNGNDDLPEVPGGKVNSVKVGLGDMPPGNNELDELPDDITLYWRVKAVDTYDLETWASPGEDGWSFDVYIPNAPNAFSLLTPADGSVTWTGDTTLTWEAAAEADPDDDIEAYWVWWATDADFSLNLDSAEVTEGTEYDLAAMLDEETYYWKVRAQDSNTVGTWSTETWTVDVYIPEAPGAFALTGPEDESTITEDEVELSWGVSTDPDDGDVVTYTLQWSTDSNFDIDVNEFTTMANSHTVTDLYANFDEMDVYWRVKASDTFDMETWADPGDMGWSFTVNEPDPPTPFTLMTPETGADITLEDPFDQEFTWEESTDPDPGDVVTYTFYLNLVLDDGDTNIDTTLMVEGVEEETYTVNIPLLLETTYWNDVVSGDWWVVAVSGDDQVECDEHFTLTYQPNTLVYENQFTGVPTKWNVAGIFPNPFNPTVQVVLAVPTAAVVHAEVYDILGRQVAVLNNNALQPGYHRFSWRATGPSGIYFLRAASATGWSAVHKMMYVK